MKNLWPVAIGMVLGAIAVWVMILTGIAGEIAGAGENVKPLVIAHVREAHLNDNTVVWFEAQRDKEGGTQVVDCIQINTDGGGVALTCDWTP